MTWDRDWIIWAAGLFEADGCFKLHAPTGSSHRNAYASLAITDRDIAEEFAGVFGLKVSGPYDYGGNRKLVWVVDTGRFEKVQAMVAAMWPWMHSRRRAKAREVLLAQTTQWTRGSDVCPSGHPRVAGTPCLECRRIKKQAYRARVRAAGSQSG
jgi:hypothetical protein